ncbi:MAG: GIY-YIG nuclease family protein [Chlorobi bacterium]|nr:GIY-YIG nuclease family protein [Chlorobiota bacterium]MCI0715585.1 GIY-YIG nuclease family protein [Chlorobiota bacterium]
MYYTYIFESKEGYRCVGVAKDVDSKLRQHAKKSSIWTKKGSRWRIIYLEEFSEESMAIQRERWLKTAAGKYYISNLLEHSKN